MVPNALNLYGLDRTGLEELFETQGLQRFRARQLLKWVYHQNLLDFGAMTDLPKVTREWFNENCHFSLPEIHHQQVSVDGTVKWLPMEFLRIFNGFPKGFNGFPKDFSGNP